MNDVISILAIFAPIPAFYFGWNFGVRRGRSLGWLEHYDQGVTRDRARRQRNGQFKAKASA